MPQTLPAGWTDILDAIHRRIAETIAAADARLQSAPTLEPTSLAQPQPEWDRWHDGLAERLRATEALIEQTDALLAAEEALVKQRHADCRSLPQKLAQWGTAR